MRSNPTKGLPSPPVDLLTVRDLARRFQVCDATIREWVRRGDLPRPIRLGGKDRWRHETLEKFLAEREAAAAREVG